MNPQYGLGEKMFRKIFVLIGVSLTLFAVACASARVMQSTE